MTLLFPTAGRSTEITRISIMLKTGNARLSPLKTTSQMKDSAPYETSLVAIFVQAIFYGVYIVTFLHRLKSLFPAKEKMGLRRKINWSMLVITMSLFLLETTNLGVNFARTFMYFTGRSQDLLVTLDAANVALKHSTFLFVDLLLIIRCWLLYSQDSRIVWLPLLLWLSCLVCPFFGINCYVPDLLFGQSQHLFLDLLLTPSVVLFFGCHIANNIYTTCAIITQISPGKCTYGRTTSTASRILAESGILYTLSSVLNFIAHARDASKYLPFALFHTILDPINFSMAGISANLLISSLQTTEEFDIPLSKSSELLGGEITA